MKTNSSIEDTPFEKMKLKELNYYVEKKKTYTRDRIYLSILKHLENSKNNF